MADIVTLDEAKEHLRIYDVNAPRDAHLERLRLAVVTLLAREGYPADREYTEDKTGGSDTLILNHHPVLSIIAVTAYSGGVPTVYAPIDITTAGPAYGYTANLAAGLLVSPSRWPFGSTVRVRYTAGYAGDADVKWAALEQIRLWWVDSQQGGHPAFGGSDEAPDPRLLPNAGLHPWIRQMLPKRASAIA